MEQTTTLQPTTEHAGKRLDSFLAEQMEGITRSAAARLLEEKQVLVNGKAASKSYKLTGSETITVTLPEPEETEVAAQDIPLDVVYEDSDVIVVNKAVGMVVHPAPGHPGAQPHPRAAGGLPQQTWSTSCSLRAVCQVIRSSLGGGAHPRVLPGKLGSRGKGRTLTPGGSATATVNNRAEWVC